MRRDEQQLVSRAQAGDLDAFEALVIEFEGYVYNLALRVVGDPSEAEDLAQQAFVRAWRGLPRFRSEAKFSTWLYRIVTNLCYNRLPQMKADLNTLIPDEDVLNLADEGQQVESGLLAAEQREILYQEIAALPESYRLLLTLRHLQELSYEEIARVTGMPVGTVKTGIFRARRKLRETLEAHEVRYA